jgi:hypothetical protein
MSETDEDLGRVIPALHELLLRLAGHVPDQVMTTSREALGHGGVGTLARIVTSAVLEHDIVLAHDDERLIRRLLVEHGADPKALSGVDVLAGACPRYSFGPLSGEPDDHDSDVAVTDVSVTDVSVTAVASVPDARGLWRTWRFHTDRLPSPAPRPLYLVEVDTGGDPVAATVLLQRALIDAGNADPQIEAYVSGTPLPTYQTLARASSELLWACSPAPEIRVAACFDEADPETRRPDRQLVGDGQERRGLVDYLRSGEPLLVTGAREADVVDPARGTVVPVDFRTDGAWIWTDAVTYYLDVHHLRPDADLVEHIRSRGFRFPELDGVDIWRAMAALTENGHDETANRGGRAEGEPR